MSEHLTKTKTASRIERPIIKRLPLSVRKEMFNMLAALRAYSGSTKSLELCDTLNYLSKKGLKREVSILPSGMVLFNMEYIYAGMIFHFYMLFSSAETALKALGDMHVFMMRLHRSL